MNKFAVIAVTASLAGLALSHPAHAGGIGGASGAATLLKSRAQLMQFLAADPTSENAYILGTYECDGFTRDLIASARAHGFVAHTVYVQWIPMGPYTQHYFVAFETSEGMVWIEPQDDTEYSQYAPNGRLVDDHLCHVGGSCLPFTVTFIMYASEGNGDTHIFDPAHDIWLP
jgi:hypothetical protein